MNDIKSTWQSYTRGEVGLDQVLVATDGIEGVRYRRSKEQSGRGSNPCLTVEIGGSRHSLPVQDGGSSAMYRVYGALCAFARRVPDKRRVEIHWGKGMSTKHYASAFRGEL
ncbi:MAG: hypothetical protein HY512_01220 [Candidatus Aenigmarchaeota archaeon]|nr:hypothetical protein [Candidatus Aenigmarchaeota archaeon]